MSSPVFDKVVCLSLDKRIEDRPRISFEFAAHRINVEFFTVGNGEIIPREYYDHIDIVPPPRAGYPAWANRPNSYNAFMCFRKIITKAKEEGVQKLLILEDDVALTPEFGEVFPKSLEQLEQYDPNWDMFYLGANHTFNPTTQVAPNLLRLNGSGCWHAVCLRHTVFDAVLALEPTEPIDGLCGKVIHKTHRCYGCWPNIAHTRPGFSHCEGHNVDYNFYFANKGC